MLKPTVYLFFVTTVLLLCGCPRLKKCDRLFNIEVSATFSEPKDTFYVGDSVTIFVRIPQRIVDSKTGEILTFPDNCPQLHTDIQLYKCDQDTIKLPWHQKDVFNPADVTLLMGNNIGAPQQLVDTFYFKMRMALTDTGRFCCGIRPIYGKPPGQIINYYEKTRCYDYLQTLTYKINEGDNNFDLMSKFMKLDTTNLVQRDMDRLRSSYYSFVVVP